jgi:sugar/nucleoside kinase (ribokinase family)
LAPKTWSRTWWQSKVTYFEGYLWDPPRAKDAIRLCADIGHKHGREMSMTLSDPFCVDRYRDEFLELMRSGTIDIMFANADEAKSLYETDNFEHAVVAAAQGLQARRDHPLRAWFGHRPR